MKKYIMNWIDNITLILLTLILVLFVGMLCGICFNKLAPLIVGGLIEGFAAPTNYKLLDENIIKSLFNENTFDEKVFVVM